MWFIFFLKALLWLECLFRYFYRSPFEIRIRPQRSSIHLLNTITLLLQNLPVNKRSPERIFRKYALTNNSCPSTNNLLQSIPLKKDVLKRPNFSCSLLRGIEWFYIYLRFFYLRKTPLLFWEAVCEEEELLRGPTEDTREQLPFEENLLRVLFGVL